MTLARFACWIFLGAVVLQGQAREFEAASIRLNTSWPVFGIAPRMKGGLFTCRAIQLEELIAVAYGLSWPRISGPEWLAKDRYDAALIGYDADAGR